MTLAVNLAQGASNNVTFRNRIINGAMVIDQRNAGASVSFTSSFAYYLDRFGGRLSSSSGSTIAQSSTAPTGFNKSLLVTIGTGASATAGQLNAFYQAIEGYNVADLGFGTANAKPITLSFWVRSSLTGTFGGSFQNNANNRSYPFTYTINSANTWEYETITIAGDTTGTWETTNSGGLTIWFDLGSGSNYQGTAGAWAGADYRAASGTTSLVATSGATINITGVQLEAGTTASPFEYRQYTTELQLCQRYYQKFNGSQYLNESVGAAAATTVIYYNKPFITSMRAAPTFSSSGTFNADGTSYSTVTLTMPYASTETARVDGAGSGFTAGQAYGLTHQSTNSYLQFTAEL